MSKKKPKGLGSKLIAKKPISFSSEMALGLIGLILAIISMVFPITWWVKTLLMLIFAGILTWIIFRLPWTIDFRLSVKVLISILVVCILAILSWNTIRDQYLKDHSVKEEQAETKLPDVGLRFIYIKDPALVIVNHSDAIARDMKYMFAIWNMDLPDRNDPLPIPIGNFDWLRPHTESGPLNLFGGPLVSPLLKSGDHLFGSASIICPKCFRGRTYIVYIVYGKSGWYSEIEKVTSGGTIIPKNFLRPTREVYFRELEAQVPQKNRIPITDPESKPFALQ